MWDPTSPLHLRHNKSLRKKQIIQTARVGLTLKRMKQYPNMPEFIMKNYRALVDPQIKKGKIHTIFSFIQENLSAQEIASIAKSSQKRIENYMELFAEGQQSESFHSWQGKSLKTEDICRLHGAFHSLIEKKGSKQS